MFSRLKISRLYIPSLCAYFHRNFKLKLILLLLACIFVILHFPLYGSPSCYRLCPYTSILDHNHLFFDRFHVVRHYSEFICPNNFRNLADWIYGWPEQVFDERLEVMTTEGRYIAPCLAAGSIIFVKTDNLGDFFEKVYPYLRNKFVLISGQSDGLAPGPYLSYLENENTKIIHWFGQNPDIYASQNSKFTPIPIGINCYEMAHAIRNVHQQSIRHTISPIPSDKDRFHQYLYPFDVTHKILEGHLNQQLLLLNFQRHTDPTGFRSRIWKTFCNNDSNSSFTVCIGKSHGVNISTLPNIYARNRRYPFWLSPRGNGLDCHRTWEALYLDIIPIVWNSTLNSLYTDLPVIILEESSELTEQFLRSKLKEITANKVKNPSVYHFQKLGFDFWRHLILSKSRHAVSRIKRENQCWSGRILAEIS